MANVPMYQGALAKARKKAHCSCDPEARWITHTDPECCIVCGQSNRESYYSGNMIYFYPELPGSNPLRCPLLSHQSQFNLFFERESNLRWAITGYVCPACRKDKNRVLSAFRQHKERMGARATHDKNCDLAKKAGFGER